MTEVLADPADPAGRASGEMLLYDYFKHMTSLALLALGGVVSIPRMSEAGAMPDMLPAIVLIVISGASALYGMEGIIKARLNNRPTPAWHRWQRSVTSFTFGLGVGWFLSNLV